MDKDKLIEKFENLLNEIEELKSQKQDYQAAFTNWETRLENDIDKSLEEFYNYLVKEVGDIE